MLSTPRLAVGCATLTGLLWVYAIVEALKVCPSWQSLSSASISAHQQVLILQWGVSMKELQASR